jgi:hypothetical protein
MFNQMSEEVRKNAIQRLIRLSGYVVSDIFHNSTDDSLHMNYAAPLIAIFYPVLRDIMEKESVVGALTLEVGLESLFEDVLEGFEKEPLTAVVQTSCGQQFSFLIRGDEVSFLGEGDLHESISDVGRFATVNSTFKEFDELLLSHADIYPTSEEILCSYRVYVYPTSEFQALYLTNRPVVIEMLVGLVFLFTVSEGGHLSLFNLSLLIRHGCCVMFNRL